MGGPSRRTLAAGLAVIGLAIAPALPACGGSDDEAATTAATTASTASTRLEPAAWDEYVETRDQARAVNEAAIKTFQKCRRLLGSSVPAEEVYACLGDSAADVVSEGQNVLAVLDGLEGEVSGACADARADLHGSVKLYTATVNAIALSIERSDLPSEQDIQQSVGTLTAARRAADEFESACAPA